ncbi:unnamed protein product [Linum trigynum]|uniref:Uncharacterized protein n=1 Tax=Linum trigynum TaxID=586398 RepID=A0AAV2CIC0_9ROSI
MHVAHRVSSDQISSVAVTIAIAGDLESSVAVTTHHRRRVLVAEWRWSAKKWRLVGFSSSPTVVWWVGDWKREKVEGQREREVRTEEAAAIRVENRGGGGN